MRNERGARAPIRRINDLKKRSVTSALQTPRRKHYYNKKAAKKLAYVGTRIQLLANYCRCQYEYIFYYYNPYNLRVFGNCADTSIRSGSALPVGWIFKGARE